MKRARTKVPPRIPATMSSLASQLNLQKMMNTLAPAAYALVILLVCYYTGWANVVAGVYSAGRGISASASFVWRCLSVAVWAIWKVIYWSYKGFAFLPNLASTFVLSHNTYTPYPWLRTALGWLAYLVGLVLQAILTARLVNSRTARKYHSPSTVPANPNDCVVCYCTLKPEKKAKFSHYCRRTICRSCLKKNVKRNLGTAGVDDRFQMCPGNCGFKLKESELVNNGLPQELIERFNYFVNHKNDARITCTNSECKQENFYNYKAVVGSGNEGKISCHKCAAWIQIKHDESLIAVSKPKGWKPCPGCGEMVERISGCNNMHHVKCGAMWCYPCGRLKSAHIGPACK